MCSQHQHLATPCWWLTLSLRNAGSAWLCDGKPWRGAAAGSGQSRQGFPERRTKQTAATSIPGFPFNGLVFVLYIRKTVNNKYCVIGLLLPLALPAFCRGEGDHEQRDEGSARRRCAQLTAWASRSRAASQLRVAGWSQGLGRER